MASKYDFIAFLDADDKWESNYLETVTNLIQREKHLNFISTGGKIITEIGTIDRLDTNMPIGSIYKPNIFKSPYIYIHTSSIVVRKIIFEEAGKFPEHLKTSEDLACFFKIGRAHV